MGTTGNEKMSRIVEMSVRRQRIEERHGEARRSEQQGNKTSRPGLRFSPRCKLMSPTWDVFSTVNSVTHSIFSCCWLCSNTLTVSRLGLGGLSVWRWCGPPGTTWVFPTDCPTVQPRIKHQKWTGSSWLAVSVKVNRWLSFYVALR